MNKLELPLHPHNLLVRWANQIRGFYGYPVYLVGSQLTDKPNPRDVDVCCILPDDVFCKRYQVKDLDQFLLKKNSGLWEKENWEWSDDMVHKTHQGWDFTNMNIDFKVISTTEDRIEYKDKPRLKLDTREDE
jgi:hypothetical protein